MAYSKISNDAKLNSFVPVRIPKVRDIFSRMGYRNTSQRQSDQVADFSRNPMERFDRNTEDYLRYCDSLQKEDQTSDKKEDQTSEKKEDQDQ